LGLTFAVGAGAIFAGHLIGKRQDERIATTERDAAEANKQAGQGDGQSVGPSRSRK